MSEWRDRLRRVPGLRAAYCALRDRWWSARAALPIGLRSKRRVSTVWGGDAQERAQRAPREWLDSEEVLWHYVFPQFGGADWYQYVRRRYCPQPRAMGLSLCCGDGHVERDLLRYGIVAAAEGVDVSDEAIEVCRREASGAGMADALTYRVGDVERERLPPQSYDVVVGWMALHHVRKIGRLLGEVARSLRPGGILVVNEYVGPARFQISDRQVELVNALLKAMPRDLRRMAGGIVKERFDRPPLRDIVRHDPSEAVHSDRVLPELKRRFALAECIGYGGTVLYWLMQGIVHNFDSRNPDHREVLDQLYAAEREALQSGDLRSDFAFVVAQRREDVSG